MPTRNVWKSAHDYPIKYITEAADFARYSVFLQPSLYCLDLNYCEYSKNDKPVNSFAAFKRENRTREILSRLHLDIPFDLEFNSKNIVICRDFTPSRLPFNAFVHLYHPGRFIIPVPVHLHNLDSCIVEYIRQSNDKLGTIRRFLAPIRIMKLYERASWSLSLYELFLPLLHQECGLDSSDLVVEVMKTFGCRFLKWVLHTKNNDLEFFLYHAQRMLYDIWDVGNQVLPVRSKTNFINRYYYPVNLPFNPVNECCIMGNMRNVKILVKYGFKFMCSENCLEEMKKYVFRCLTPRLEETNFVDELNKNIAIVSRNIEESGLSLERCCHLFLAVELFLFKIYTVMSSNYPAVKEVLSCIWNSIPQPYLCRSEITTLFKGTCRNAVVEFCHFYDNVICEGDFADNYNPRSLSHLSRCQARKALGDGWQLPHGITTLHLPSKIKMYLSLDV